MLDRLRLPLEWLACPVSKAPLMLLGDVLVSSYGSRYLKGADGYWDFMPRNHSSLQSVEWRIWDQLQANGVASYSADPEHNLGVGKRQDFIQFANFCRFRGNVLDVGVGPQRCPSHIEYEYSASGTAFFVGVDPLIGEQPRCFAFVRALGEYLPFRASVFDQVLFVTSLDHFIDPLAPLREAARVLAGGGEVCIWLGEKDKNAPKPSRSNPWYERLAVPEGAEDRFHYKRFSAPEFERFLMAAGLEVTERSVHEIDSWRRNLFYRASVQSAPSG